MSLFFDGLYKASFRGASFLIRNCEKTFGRKVVIYEYPNQDKRGTVDLGKYLRKYSITAVISGNLYSLRKKALEQALQKPGIGIYVDPQDGRVNVVVAQQPIVTYDDQRVGECEIKIEFEEATPAIYPVDAGDNISKILEQVNVALDSVETAIQDIFNVSDRYRYNIDSAANILTRIQSQFSNVTAPFINVSDSSNQFLKTLDDFGDNIFNNIKAPKLLGTALIGLFNESDELGSTPSDKLKIANGFFNFDSGKDEFISKTTQSIEREKNRKCLNSAVNYSALVNAYKNAVDIDYQSIEELDQYISLLEDQYLYVIQNSGLDVDSINELTSLRNEMRKFFDRLSLNIYSITTINTQPCNLISVIYSYYGDLANKEKIVKINGIANSAIVSGDLKIFSGNENDNN